MPKYEKRITIGRDSAGKPIRKRFYGNTKAELERQLFEWQKQSELITNPDNPTLGKYIEKWLAINEPLWELSTYKTYAKRIPLLKEVLPVELKKVKESDLQRIISDNSHHPRQCQFIRRILLMVFNMAERDGLIAINPAKHLTVPKHKPQEKKPFTDQERKAIQEVKLNDRDRMVLDTFYNFGLRPGELFALKPSDFDWNNNLLYVKRAVYDGRIKSTKTGVSRAIPIPDKYKAKYKPIITQNKALFVFVDESGQPLNNKRIDTIRSRISRTLNIYTGGNSKIRSFDFNFYRIRHDYASRLYLYGVKDRVISTKQAAAWMGHSEIMFLETYSHLMEEKTDVTELMQKIAF